MTIVREDGFQLYAPGHRKGNKYWIMRAYLNGRGTEINTYALDQIEAAARARQLIASYYEEIREEREREIIESECLVYFISDGVGHIKIGSSTDPLTRLRDLQVGAPYQLTLLGVIAGDRKAEKTLHGQFRWLRQSGEWFRAAPQLERLIRERCMPDPMSILGRRNAPRATLLKFNAN